MLFGMKTLERCAGGIALVLGTAAFAQTTDYSTVSGNTQEVATVISGTGGVRVNPAASGGGMIKLTALNTYTGSTELGCGTLWITSLANGGQPSSIGASSAAAGNLKLGPGTLRYAGPDVVTDRGFTLQAAQGRAVTLWADSDITFGGQIACPTGSFIKRGPGTVTFAGSGNLRLSMHSGNTGTSDTGFPENGDSPATMFPGVLIADGRLVWGSGANANMQVSGQLWIGGRTTEQAGMEQTGELEIVGGYTRVSDYLIVGRNNGTPTTAATVPLLPRFILRDGTCSANAFAMGYDNQKANAVDAVADIYGGTLHINRDFRLGNARGDADNPSRATFNMHGGMLLHTNEITDFPDGICFGWENPPPEAVFNLFGGTVLERTTMRMGRYGAVSRLNLHGGLLRAQNITADSGEEYLHWSGGVFQPCGNGDTLQNLTELLVSTNGVVIDTAFSGPDGFVISQAMKHDPTLGGTPDGGLTKLGAGRLSVNAGAHTFTGPVTVSGGVLRANGAALKHAAVFIAPGAALEENASVTATELGSLTLGASGDPEPAILDLPYNPENGCVLPIVVTNALTVHAARVTLHRLTDLVPMLPVGVHTVLTFNAASALPNAAAFSIDPDMAIRSAAFAVEDAAPGWKQVVMTVTAAYPAVSSWVTPGDGAWGASQHWDFPPPALRGAAVNFANAIPTGGATVSIAGTAYAGQMLLDAAATGFTFSGGTLALRNIDSPASVSVPRGAHTVASAVSLEESTTLDTRAGASLAIAGAVSGGTELRVNPQASGGGLVALSGGNTFAGTYQVDCGTLRFDSPSSLGFPDMFRVGAGTLMYAGEMPAESATTLRLEAPYQRAATVWTTTNLTFNGAISSASGTFIKRGPGTLTLVPTNNDFSLSRSGSDNVPGDAFPENGDSPTQGFPAILVADGRLAIDVADKSVSLAETWIGAKTTSAAGAETTGEVEFLGGTVRIGGWLIIGRNNGNWATAGGKRLNPRAIMRGGKVTVNTGLVMAYDNTSPAAHAIDAVLDIHDGEMTFGGEFRLGNHRGDAGHPSTATINVYGGALIHTNEGQHMVMGWVNPAPASTLNLFGGFVQERGNVQMGNNGSESFLNLRGGTLRANNITAGTGNEYLLFDGGVFQPTGMVQSLANGFTSATVSTNGAWFDISLAGGGVYTLQQPLARCVAELGDASDDGIVKTGSNMLVLAAVNTFAGPVTVADGVLRATVDGAVPDELRVLDGGVFDAAGAVRSIPRVSGDGLCSNGTVRVTAAVAPDAGKTLTFDGLTFATGATLRHTGNLVVDGELATEGAGVIDFGRTVEDPLPYPFSAVVATYRMGMPGFAGWQAVGTGYRSGAYTVRLFRDETVTPHVVRAETSPSGTLFMIQ